MAKSLPPPVSHSRPTPVRASAREERSGPALPPLQVRYYRKMHRQRVYAVTVSWHNKDERRPPAGTGPVLLRLLMAGAQVVPSEQPLDPARRDARATFYVTPLATGWLRGERLEVLVDGRKVQEMPLAVNVTSQRMTWCLFALSFLLPWFLLSYGKYSPLKQTTSEKSENAAIVHKEFERAQDPLVEQVAKGDKKRPVREVTTPGRVLESRIADNVPAVPAAVNDHAPAVGDYLKKARRFVADVYDTLSTESGNRERPLPFYVAACLLLLTAISWWMHGEKRKRRIGMPVSLPAGAAVSMVSED